MVIEWKLTLNQRGMHIHLQRDILMSSEEVNDIFKDDCYYSDGTTLDRELAK